MSCKQLIGVLILMGVVVPCDAQCFSRVRACPVRTCCPPRCCWSPAPPCQVVCQPYCGPQVTSRLFGYRAPFNYGYAPAYRTIREVPSNRAGQPTLADEPVGSEVGKLPDATQAEPVVPSADDAEAVVPADAETPKVEPIVDPTVEPTVESTVESVPMQDLVTTAKAMGKFGKLLDYAKRAKLLAEVSGGPFTIFAPTDAAFGKLDPAVVQRLENDSAFLSQVLRHHAVASAHSIEELIAMKKASPFSGADLQVERTAAGVLVSGVRVQQADVQCTDGVVHVIEDVLVPTDAVPADSVPTDSVPAETPKDPPPAETPNDTDPTEVPQAPAPAGTSEGAAPVDK